MEMSKIDETQLNLTIKTPINKTICIKNNYEIKNKKISNMLLKNKTEIIFPCDFNLKIILSNQFKKIKFEHDNRKCIIIPNSVTNLIFKNVFHYTTKIPNSVTYLVLRSLYFNFIGQQPILTSDFNYNMFKHERELKLFNLINSHTLKHNIIIKNQDYNEYITSPVMYGTQWSERRYIYNFDMTNIYKINNLYYLLLKYYQYIIKIEKIIN